MPSMATSSTSSSSSSSRHPYVKKEPSILHSSVAIANKLARPSYPNNNDIEPYDFSRRKGFSCCSCLPFIWQLVLLATTGSFLFGFNLSLLNTALKAINVNYGWCPTLPNGHPDTGCTTATLYCAFMSTAVFVGAAIGSMTGGRFIPMGRRMCLLLSMAVFAFGIVDSCVSNSFPALLWARLCVGYAVGVVSVVSPMYLAEMSPKEKRGSYGVMHQLMVTVGIFIAVLIGLPFSDPKDYTDQPMFDKVWWRVMLGLGMIPTALAAYLLMFCYDFETPHWYVEQGRFDDATSLLRIIYKRDDVSEEMGDIKDGIKQARDAKAAGVTLASAMGDSVYRFVIVVGCLLSAFQQFTGINVFIASSNALFEDAGLSGTLVTTFSTILTLVNTLMTFPSIFLIEKLGRKTLLLVGTAGQFVGVAPAAICYWVDKESDVTQWLAIAGSIVFIVFFAVAYGPVLWVFLFEIYPAEIKGTAAGLATACNWIAGIVMVFATSFLENQISYTIFAIMSLVAVFLVFFLVRETKGRSIDNSPYAKKKPARVEV